MAVTIDQILQTRMPGTYFTDEDKYEIAQAIINAHQTGFGLIMRNVEKADGYPRGEKVSYKHFAHGSFKIELTG